MNKINFINKILSSDSKIVSRLFGGMMNESYIVESNNKKYIAYFPTAKANKLVDRSLEKECQQVYFENNITSKNVYFDVIKGIKINEYIDGDSLNHVSNYSFDEISKIMHKIHDCGTLASQNYNPFARFVSYEKPIKNNMHININLYQDIKKVLFDNKEFLLSQKLCLCHNDSQKSNIIISKDNHYYFIDFEFAANNDPIYDIAAFGNNSVMEGYELLTHYSPSTTLNEKKRYFLWRMFISLQWYLVALLKDKQGEGITHNMDFKEVANHFLNNASESLEKFKEILYGK